MRPLVFALVCGLIGCDALLGIEELPRATVTEDASGIDTPPPPNEACVSCETTTCGAKRSACLGDGACAPLLDCVDHCAAGDVRCRAHCEQVHVTGTRTKAFAEIDVCRRKSCVNECFGASGFGTAIEPDCACLNASCGAKMLACVQSGVEADPPDNPGACDRRLACIAKNANPDGYIDCVMDLQGGDQANDLLNCMHDNDCPAAGAGPRCPIYPGVLSCLRQFSYATAPGQIEAFTFGLEALNKEPVVGATVIACSGAKCGPDCIVQGTGTTDEKGKATFLVKTPEGGFDGCLYVAPHGDFMGMNVVPGRRIRRNESMITSYALEEGILAIYAPSLRRNDPAYGHVLIAVHDCIWRRLAGATIEMTNTDSETVRAYLLGTTVAEGATATTRTGAAAYINVPVGKKVITVKLNGEVIATQEITVRGSELTDVNLYPAAR